MTGNDNRAPWQTILVVDDEPAIREAFCEFLSDLGYIAMPAKDARSMLVTLEKLPVHLVLLDLVLPDIYGLDLLPQLRAQFPSVGILVMSGYLTEESERQCFTSGATAVIRKPVHLPVLAGVIASTLDAKGARGPTTRQSQD